MTQDELDSPADSVERKNEISNLQPARTRLYEAWIEKTLGELCNSIRYGLTAKSSPNQEGTLYLRITDIDMDGKLRLTEPHYVDIDDETYEKYSLQKNDILIARSGATAGKAFIFSHDLKSVFASYLIRFRAKEEIVDPKFLFSFLHSPQYWQQLEKKKVGGAQPNVNADSLRHIMIPVPPLMVQKRIVARIEQLTSRIDQAKKLREEALKETEAIMQAALHQTFKNSEQKGWKLEKLGQIVEMKGGGTPSKEKSHYWTGNIPWVSPKDMKTYEIYDSQDHITKEALEKSATNLIETGNVLVVFRSGILAHTIPIALNRVPVTINQDMKALNATNKDLSNEYLCWFLRSAKERLLQCVKFGATVHSIEVSRFEEVFVPIPELEEQKRIVKHFESIRTKVEALQALQSETKKEIDQMTLTVLRMAFSGQL